LHAIYYSDKNPKIIKLLKNESPIKCCFQFFETNLIIILAEFPVEWLGECTRFQIYHPTVVVDKLHRPNLPSIATDQWRIQKLITRGGGGGDAEEEHKKGCNGNCANNIMAKKTRLQCLEFGALPNYQF